MFLFFSIFWCTLQPKLFILYFISHRGRKKSPLHMDTKILIMRFLTHMIQSRRIGRMFDLGSCKKSYCQRLSRKNVLIQFSIKNNLSFDIDTPNDFEVSTTMKINLALTSFICLLHAHYFDIYLDFSQV